MSPVIMLFAKAPVPGNVKTRLQPILSAAQSAELHRSFVGDVLEWLAGFTSVAEIELHTDAVTDAWAEFPYRRVLQAAGDLGHRMRTAAEIALLDGRPQAVILGSDVPHLPAGHLCAVLASKADVALGPTDDGGYYAIGLRKSPPKLFDGVEWSTARALEQTARAAERCGLTVELTRPFFDIDSPADLRRLALGPTPPRTAAWLAQNHLRNN